MEVTPNIGLKKPSYLEDADISDINDNSDVIDSEIKSLQDGVSEVNTSLAGKASTLSLEEEISAREAADTALRYASLSVGDELPANSDLDTLISPGKWYCAATNANSCANRPLGTTTGGFGVKVETYFSNNRFVMTFIYNVATGSTQNRIFKRIYSSAGWSNWFELAMTEIVPSSST